MELSEPLVIVLAVIAAFMVGLSKGGMSLLGVMAVPIMALVISPVAAAAMLLPIFVVSDMFGLWSYRREFDARNLRILVPWGIAGVGIGWATASIISERWVALIVGLIGVFFCVNAWRQRHLNVAAKPADVPRGAFWGTLMGFTSFVSHSGGAPYQVYVLPQQLPKTIYAGTTTIVFAILNAVKLLPYWALGQFNAPNLRMSAWLMPVAVAGTFAGVRLVRILPQAVYFRFVQIALFVVSLKLVWDAL